MFEQRLKGREGVIQVNIFRKRVQTEETAKASKQECAWHIHGLARRLVWLEWGEQRALWWMTRSEK